MNIKLNFMAFMFISILLSSCKPGDSTEKAINKDKNDIKVINSDHSIKFIKENGKWKIDNKNKLNVDSKNNIVNTKVGVCFSKDDVSCIIINADK